MKSSEVEIQESYLEKDHERPVKTDYPEHRVGVKQPHYLVFRLEFCPSRISSLEPSRQHPSYSPQDSERVLENHFYK